MTESYCQIQPLKCRSHEVLRVSQNCGNPLCPPWFLFWRTTKRHQLTKNVNLKAQEKDMGGCLKEGGCLAPGLPDHVIML